MMIAVRVLLLATLLGLASAADPFGTAPSCSVVTRPQIAFPGAYVTMANVRALSCADWLVVRSDVCSIHPHTCLRR